MKIIIIFLSILISILLFTSCTKSDEEILVFDNFQLMRIDGNSKSNVVWTFSYDYQGMIKSSAISFKNDEGLRDTNIYHYYRSSKGVLKSMGIERKRENEIFSIHPIELTKDKLNRIIKLVELAGNKPFKVYHIKYNDDNQVTEFLVNYPNYPFIGVKNNFEYNIEGQLQYMVQKNLDGTNISEVFFENIGKIPSNEASLIERGAIPFDATFGTPYETYYGGVGTVIRNYQYDEIGIKKLVETTTVTAITLNEKGYPTSRSFKDNKGAVFTETFGFNCLNDFLK